MSDHLELWQRLRTPPKDALKEIRGGRLKGMHDINPTWRYEALTEALGPCGEGWCYEIADRWTEDGPDGQRAQFVQVNLFTKTGGEWSRPIPGVGGSMLVAKESAGLYFSDEAVKMALTDALGTAAQKLGLAADVYRGQMNGSKYERPADKEKPAAQDGEKADPLKWFWQQLKQDFGEGAPWEVHEKRRMMQLIFGTTTIKDIKALSAEEAAAKLKDLKTGYVASHQQLMVEIKEDNRKKAEEAKAVAAGAFAPDPDSQQSGDSVPF